MRWGVRQDVPELFRETRALSLISTDVEAADLRRQTPGLFNIASYLPLMASQAPDRPAVVVTKSRGWPGRRTTSRQVTFSELEARSNRYANGLAAAGFTREMRVLLMVKPGIEFVALVFALFKVGAVPVMIDPGMGVGRMLECIRQIRLSGLIGIPIAQSVRVLRPKTFRTVEHVITVGRRWFWRGPTLGELERGAAGTFTPADTSRDSPAAILFTSGSTGPAKGVVYNHGTFDAQVRAIQSHYGIKPGEIDLPGFPLFALFSVAMGMTCVFPEMNPSRPALVDPARIVAAVGRHHVTNSFGSPAMWNRVATFCVDRGIKLPTLRRVLIAGAPVSWRLIDRLKQVLSAGADVHTPYGATEALPVTSISGTEVLNVDGDGSRGGAGICVGLPLPGMDVRVIRITDEPIAAWSNDLVTPDGNVGEIVVRGPIVAGEYFGLPDATALAKIPDGDRTPPSAGVWHRMGDVGYRDPMGRLWFCGRKAHRVVTEHGTMFSVPCEMVFNEHPDVQRSALVGIGPRGRQTPVIVVEPHSGRFPRGRRAEAFRTELLALGRAGELTAEIDRVLFHRSFPVDVRHNAKINREALAEWAARRL